MTAKEFLQSIRMERMEVDHMSDMLEELRTSLLPSAIRYDKIDVQVSLPDDPMAETFAKIEEIETQIRDHLTGMMDKYNRAVALVLQLEKSEHRQVLQAYYLDPAHPKWQQVADRLGYSEQHIFRLHNDAIEQLEKDFKDESK
jgi:DNA-directed RNA polymerase specialized sigma subunit